MSQQTEKEIIRAALPFIRSHYKFRPRGEAIMETRYEVASSCGVIADGYLAFNTEEGEPFIVTVESSCVKSRNEVAYAIQDKLLNWDSLACTALVIAAGYIYFHYEKGYNIAQMLGEIPTVLMLSGGFCLGLFLFRLLLGWMRRYRYIYAIEQFKQYDATEQWIALGEHVFESPLDKDFLELKEQCVDNGFGLVMVNEDMVVQMLITPARDAVLENRQGVNFDGQKGAVATSPKSIKKWLSDTINRVTKARSTVGLDRYRAGFFNQLIALFFGLSIITGIFYTEWQDSPIAYVDEDQYQRDRLVTTKNIQSEDKGYLLSEDRLLNWDSITGNYLSLEESIWTDDEPATSSITYEPGELLELEANPKNKDKSSTEIVVANRDGYKTSYDCERFYNFTGALYLVQDGVYTDLSVAQRRLHLLNNADFTGNILWLGCFGDETKYVVYYDLMYPKRMEAATAAKTIISDLKRMKIPYGTLKIRTLRKSTN